MTADEPVTGVPRLCARRADCTRPRGHDDECGPDRADTELADLRAEVERANRVIAEYERKVWRRDQRLLELEGVARTNAAWVQQQHAATKEAREQRDAAGARALLDLAAEMDADGWFHKDDWGVPVIYPEALRKRAAALDAVKPADQCGVVWHISPSVSWSCGLPTGHEGAHLNPDFPERYQGPEHLRVGS